jgi:hypothetical protein
MYHFCCHFLCVFLLSFVSFFSIVSPFHFFPEKNEKLMWKKEFVTDIYFCRTRIGWSHLCTLYTVVGITLSKCSAANITVLQTYSWKNDKSVSIQKPKAKALKRYEKNASALAILMPTSVYVCMFVISN